MNSTGKNILNNFKIILGEYCVINQFVELAKRCFVTDHTADFQTRDSFSNLAHQNHICLTNYDPDAMIGTISRSYIVNVQLCFETFLKNICEEAKKLGIKDFAEKKQDDSWLTHARKNILAVSIPDDKMALFDLCEYYRLIRNTAVHDLCDVKLHHQEYKKLIKYNFNMVGRPPS